MSKPKLLITRRIPDEALSMLTPHFEIDHYNKPTAIPRAILLKKLKDKDALFCILTEKIDRQLLDAGPKLKAITTYSVGYDHIDTKACTERGIPVTHTPGVLTETCADFALAMILAVSRRLAEGDKYMRGGKYKGWDPLMMLGTDIHGKTLGIVGFGRIGQAVARRAQGFSMKVLYTDVQRVFPEVEKQLGAEYVEMDELLRRSDFITLHTVMAPETFHLIGEKAFALMKKSAYLINTSRGPVVDEKALVRALKTGRIRGAALDVYEREPKMAPGLNKCANALLIPHLASASLETRTKMGTLAAQGLLDAMIHKTKPAHLANPAVLEKH